MIGRCKRCGAWFLWAEIRQYIRLRLKLGRHPFKLPKVCGSCAVRALIGLGRNDAFEAWQDWYRENCSEWDDIDNIEGELGRRED